MNKKEISHSNKNDKIIDYNSDISDYHKFYNSYKNNNNDIKRIKIALLSSYTIDQLEPLLGVELIKRNINPEFYLPGYNQYENQIYNNKSDFYKNKPDIIFFSLRLEDILPELFYLNNDLSYQNMIDPLIEKIFNLIVHMKENISADIFFSNFLLPKFMIQNIAEFQNKYGQSGAIYMINQKLKDLVKEIEGLYIFDLLNIATEFGTNKVFDDKMEFYASIPYTMDFMKFKAFRLSKYFDVLKNTRKKCLVLDLDNSLWGGIIGEDNLNGIKLGKEYPGNIYIEIQKMIKEIGKTGVLLAINSKNNYDDAKEVFNNHPYSILKLDDFSSIQINWNEKHLNMLEIAKELNIGTDSFVFIDDNPVEIGAINYFNPEIKTIQFDQNNPLKNLKMVRQMDYFYSLKITNEDLLKTDQYKHQTARKRLQKTFKNSEDYFSSLNITINVNKPDSFSIPRISQLTMKTNQFNLTTKRYKESEINKFISSDNSFIYYLRVKDDIGDYGIVGVFIGFSNNKDIIIDSFLMSCRVIGRSIENAFIITIFNKLKEDGLKNVKGEYIQSKKNSIVKTFYKDLGFKKKGSLWNLDLSNQLSIPNWINIDEKIS